MYERDHLLNVAQELHNGLFIGHTQEYREVSKNLQLFWLRLAGETELSL